MTDVFNTFRGNTHGVEFRVELISTEKTVETKWANIDSRCVRKGQAMIS